MSPPVNAEPAILQTSQKNDSLPDLLTSGAVPTTPPAKRQPWMEHFTVPLGNNNRGMPGHEIGDEIRLLPEVDDKTEIDGKLI